MTNAMPAMNMPMPMMPSSMPMMGSPMQGMPMMNMMPGMSGMPGMPGMMGMGMMPVMCRMTYEMTKDGITCKLTPGEGISVDMMKERCEAMARMMSAGMPMMMMCGGMPMMMCMPSTTK